MKLVFTMAAVTTALGCIKAPPIVVVDRATALEQQAAGSYEEMEKKLTHAAVSPRPIPFTPDQLEALGVKPQPLTDSLEATDADKIDLLLQQHCLGEKKDGLLADTHDDCVGAADHAASVVLLDRVNHARVQLFEWMEKEKPNEKPGALRGAWREAHLKGVVCGGWVETDAGWGAKKC